MNFLPLAEFREKLENWAPRVKIGSNLNRSNMRPPRFHRDILHQTDSDVIHSIETDDNNGINGNTQQIPVVNLDNPTEATIAMESQTFELNRAQTIDYL